MNHRLHPIAGLLAMALIATFWSATLVSELSGSETLITRVKTLIPWGFLALIPALAATGGTGFALAGPRRAGPVAIKVKRMRVIAANGLLALIPSALFLAMKARADELDAVFYAVQAVELIAGAVNLWLLGLNFRDGRRMTAGRRRAARPPCRSKLPSASD